MGTTKEIQLGNEVQDIVSGIKGIAVARHEFLNGCIRFSIQQKADKEGKMPDEKWLDVGQLKVVGKGVSIPKKNTGGPTSTSVPKGLRA